MSNSSALIGAFVMVWFPEAEAPGRPGPKFRPALVLDVREGKARVAYCTSQHHDHFGRGEVIFKDGEIENLRGATKLCLSRTAWIPLSKAFFSNANAEFVVLGRIPYARQDDLVRALREVQAT